MCEFYFREVRWHGQAHLVGAIRSRSPACIFLIRTQIIGRCCCIISHKGVARPNTCGRGVPLSQRSSSAPARQTVSRYVLCLILVGNTDHIIVIVQSRRGESGLGGGAQLLLQLLPIDGGISMCSRSRGCSSRGGDVVCVYYVCCVCF